MPQCMNRCKADPLPPGLTPEAAKWHPRYTYYLEPGARCIRVAGHDGPHRTGHLIWHDPPIVFVGGKRVA